ncbi:MAG: bacteriohopanetetrol glucosamine biosynthesis glycosyltransferase HpnI [Acidobacteria bacterium]|nr:bacteriohopanetetrol glucosamine biosynthesis glycosyltransferase HpnI [Acidobacteriota bacterium]
MLRLIAEWVISVGALLPLLYYLAAVYISWSYFRRPAKTNFDFLPPVSILKPVRGAEQESYENFSSFCNLDYPEYEILFGVNDADDPAVPVIEKLIQDFPRRSIRLLIGSSFCGSNDKVRKLCRLNREARYKILVVSDSDIRVGPDYLRAVVSPFRTPAVGAVTCPYLVNPESRLGPELEAIGVTSDFFPGVLVARQLEGVKFALGATMAVRAEALAEIGGFEAIADSFSDDYELGKRIAAKGRRVELIPYTVWTVPASEGTFGFFKHQLRWAVGVRNSRPRGHFGRIFSQGLPWVVAAAFFHQAWSWAAVFLGAYLITRLAMAWTVAVWGLKDPLVRRKWWLIPLWDAVAFAVWAMSFTQNRVCWSGVEFYVRKGKLIPVASR